MNETDVKTNNSQTNNKKRLQISPPVTALIIALIIFLLSGFLPAGYSSLQGAIRQGLNILRLASFIAIIGAGQTLVIISGGEGIDLSAAPVVTIGALLTFMLIDGQNNLILPVLLLVILIGAIIGLLNGLGITYLKISPFVMTLGMAGVVQGALILWAKGYYDGAVAPIITQLTARNIVWGIPGMIFIWIIIGILMTILLKRTRYGKQLFAIGVNRLTARLSGVRVNRMVVLTYAIASAMAAFAGFLLVGYTQSAGPNLGNQYLFPWHYCRCNRDPINLKPPHNHAIATGTPTNYLWINARNYPSNLWPWKEFKILKSLINQKSMAIRLTTKKHIQNNEFKISLKLF